jgi:hypothetical protein
MLTFTSSNARVVNAQRAALELLELAYGTTTPEVEVLLVNATVGHDLAHLSHALQAQCPHARVLAASCAGVVGPDGPGESLHDVGLLGISGQGYTVAHVNGLYGDTSYECGVELGRQLQASAQPVRMMYLMASGIDIANDLLLAGIESVLGPDVVIFGATSSDQMRGVASYQAIDGVVYNHAAYAVGIWDPSLRVDTQATHGFVAAGEPMTVTAADGNRIIELDGRAAWPAYLDWLGLPEVATTADTIPIGALAQLLAPELATEYGNDHILRVVTHYTDTGEIVYATTIEPGTQLWLTVRDEDRIFADMDRMMAALVARNPDSDPVAVFQADCLARGRRLFERVMKEELVQRMQQPLSGRGTLPAWFGVYGFGEYARLGGRNEYHNYTTALAALYRDLS